jgi:tetrahydromethanopterin S-methyltransferase subunit G
VRKRVARSIAILTGMVIVALLIAFAMLQNP